MKTRYLVVFGILLVLAIVVIIFLSGNKISGNVIADTGKIEIAGSDTLLQLVSGLAESYSKQNPNVKISVTGGGSGAGIASLINGNIDIADASRKIKQEELDNAAANGVKPFEFVIANDMLSVIVNEDNPVKKLTIDQLSEIFKGNITNWKQVGGDDKEITLYGRQSTSGTYTFFMEDVVKGDYSPEMRNLEGNQAILDAVKQDSSGIGYAGLGYIADESGNKVSGINVIEVSKNNLDYFSPLNKQDLAVYPISRALFQYFSKKPEKGSAAYNFLMFELGKGGQDIVKQSGFMELTSSDVAHNNQKLNGI